MTTRIDYTSRDYEAIITDLIARIPEFAARWTNHNPTDPGIVAVELTAFLSDCLHYYVDRRAGDLYLPSAITREAVTKISRLIGYRLDGPVTATTTLRFSIPEAHSVNIPIPRRTVCNRLDGLAFSTTQDGVITTGQTYVDISAAQGRYYTQEETSDGTADQAFEVDLEGVAHGSVAVTVDSVAWSEVDTFVGLGASERKFRVTRDHEGKTSVRFGDGKEGAIPANGGTVVIEHMVTDGVNGNSGSGTITEIDGAIKDENEAVVSDITVTNSDDASGGADEETVEHAKDHAPQELHSLWMMMALPNIESLVAGYPGVLKCKARDRNTDGEVARYLRIYVTVIPNGGGMPSAQLKADLKTFIDARKVKTMEIIVEDPEYVETDVTVTIYVLEGYEKTTVTAAVQTAVEDFFDPANRDFGEDLDPDELVAVIDRVTGVSYAEVSEPSSDVAAGDNQMVSLGTLTVDAVSVDEES